MNPDKCTCCGLPAPTLQLTYERRLSLTGEAFLCSSCYGLWVDDDWDNLARAIKKKLLRGTGYE